MNVRERIAAVLGEWRLHGFGSPAHPIDALEAIVREASVSARKEALIECLQCAGGWRVEIEGMIRDTEDAAKYGPGGKGK